MSRHFRASIVARLTFALVLALTLGFALAGCGTSDTPRGYKPTLARFYLESADASGQAVTLPKSGVQISLNQQPVITEGDIVNVELVQVDLGKCLMFKLTSSAARDLYRLTGSHQGRRLVLLLDGSPTGARRIDVPLANGEILLFAEVADEALPRLVQELKTSATAIQRAMAKK